MSAVEYAACPHEKKTKHHDENDNRVRNCEYCDPCNTYWFGVYAKRLDDEGSEAWGPVGQWCRSAYSMHDVVVSP